jgi:hypothetical protein
MRVSLKSRDQAKYPKGSSCQICDEERELVWDHDHKTGEFRGWLCQGCNVGLGQLGDSVDGLLRAINYLMKPLVVAIDASNS